MLSKHRQGCSFCNKAGAVFNDSLSFATYIQALDHGSGEPPSKDKPTKPNAEVNTPELTEHHAVYLMSRKVPTEQDVNETKNFLKEKMGFDLKVLPLAVFVNTTLTPDRKQSYWLARIRSSCNRLSTTLITWRGLGVVPSRKFTPPPLRQQCL